MQSSHYWLIGHECVYINNDDPPASSRRPYHRSAPPAPPDGLFGSVAPYQPSSLVKGCRFAPGSVVSQQSTLGCERASALRLAHSARAESGAAAHVRGERRARGWRCRFVFFCTCIYIFRNAFFPLPALYILQVSPDSIFCFFSFVFPAAAASVLSILANRVEGESEGGCAHSLYFRMTSFSKNSRMHCSHAHAQWGLLHCSMQRHSARARDK